MIAKKRTWFTYVSKVDHSNPIAMKLTLDLSCHLLNENTKLQIDISKHAEKSPENSDGYCHGIIRSYFKRLYKKEIAPIRLF